MCESGPHLLDEEKDRHLAIFHELLDHVTSECKFLQQVINGVKLGFSSRIWRPNDKFRMANNPIALTKEGLNEQIRSKIHAHCFI